MWRDHGLARPSRSGTSQWRGGEAKCGKSGCRSGSQRLSPAWCRSHHLHVALAVALTVNAESNKWWCTNHYLVIRSITALIYVTNTCTSFMYHEPSNAQRNHTANTDNYGLMQWSAINVWTHGAQSNWGILERNTETLSPLRKLWKEALHLRKLLACLHLRFHIDPTCFYCLSRSWDRTREPGSLHVSD